MAALQLTRQRVMVNGMPVIYEITGTGEPLVIVHGLGGSGRWWKPTLPALSQHFQLYLIDLPGFGLMRRQRKHFSLAHAGEWLEAWTQAVGLETFSLLGHSMGGYVCMSLAVLAPEKVKHLILLDSIGIPFERSARQLLLPTAISMLHTTPAFWPILLYDSHVRAGIPMVMRAANQIVALDAGPVIDAVRTPTLLIWGDNDELVPLEFGYRLRDKLAKAQARLLVLKKANHIAMYDQPQQFSAGALAFLSGQEVGI